MELLEKDKVENEIQALLVVPQNDRLYDYYINGHQDRRVMLQKKMLQFCIDLCHLHAAEIRQAIHELTPFIIYPKDQEFSVLQRRAPPPPNMREMLLPMGRLVREDKIDHTKENKNFIDTLGNNYSVWREFNIYLDELKKKSANKAFENPFR